MHYSVFLPADRCAHALHYPKVALLFLTMGEMPHEPLWRLWFEELGNLVYRGCDPDAVEASEDCKNAAQRIGAQRDGHPIASQQLFNVYVPNYLGVCCSCSALVPPGRQTESLHALQVCAPAARG